MVERAAGRVQLIETTGRTSLGAIEGLGDLSHASVVYSRDGRFAFVFGRDGGLSKVDLLEREVAKRVVQAGNSIGGAISQDGSLVAVSNYEPGGVRVSTPRPWSRSPTSRPPMGRNARSKVVGLVDAPGRRFVFSLYDAGEIWVADLSDPAAPEIRKFADVGVQPYDGMITPDGRHYLAGLFGEDGVALLDLWDLDKGVQRILDGYGRGEEPLPVYKMPHLEGWATPATPGPAGGRPPRAPGRGSPLAGGRPHRRARPAGVRGWTARRPPGLGQLRPPRQRRRGRSGRSPRHHFGRRSVRADHPSPQPFRVARRPKLSPDGRFVYFASRDGWISKYDIWGLELIAEVRAGINTRNLALSHDGQVLAVANYLPHSLVLLDAADLAPLEVIPAADARARRPRG